MEQVKGKMIKVLTTKGEPIHNGIWMKEVTYYPEDIAEGRSAELHYDNFTKVCTTPEVELIREDENNVVLMAKNENYYIKKFRE